MERNGKLVIFDLDGTLLDTVADLGAAVNYALSLRGLPEHTDEEYKRMVGHGVRDLVTRSLPENFRDESTVASALEDFKAYYCEHIDRRTRPYEGMTELVSNLDAEGYSLAVASNKFQEGTQRLVGRFFPSVSFSAILGNSPGAPLKPSPQIVHFAMAASGVDSPDKVIMVGDSETDIATASNAGIRSIAVTWGFRSKEELSDADAVADTPAKLYELVRGH